MNSLNLVNYRDELGNLKDIGFNYYQYTNVDSYNVAVVVSENGIQLKFDYDYDGTKKVNSTSVAVVHKGMQVAFSFNSTISLIMLQKTATFTIYRSETETYDTITAKMAILHTYSAQNSDDSTIEIWYI